MKTRVQIVLVLITLTSPSALEYIAHLRIYIVKARFCHRCAAGLSIHSRALMSLECHVHEFLGQFVANMVPL